MSLFKERQNYCVLTHELVFNIMLSSLLTSIQGILNQLNRVIGSTGSF